MDILLIILKYLGLGVLYGLSFYGGTWVLHVIENKYGRTVANTIAILLVVLVILAAVLHEYRIINA